MLDKLSQLFQIRREWLLYGLLLMVANIVLAAIIIQKTASPFWNLINMLMPMWGAFMAGSILGYLIAVQPFRDMTYNQRLLRAKILGILLATVIFFIFYIFSLVLGKKLGGL